MALVSRDSKRDLLTQSSDVMCKHQALYFIHINKTAGSSIEVALKLPMEHKTALEKIDEVGWSAWREAFTFSVVRNPWDKVVSHYCFRVKTNQTALGDGHLAFGDWVRACYRDKDSRYYDQPKMFMPQVNWLSDDAGEIVVDHVARFERLGEDMKLVENQIKRSFTLQHLNKTTRKPYPEYYDETTRSIVHDWFAEDIRTFCYAF